MEEEQDTEETVKKEISQSLSIKNSTTGITSVSSVKSKTSSQHFVSQHFERSGFHYHDHEESPQEAENSIAPEQRSKNPIFTAYDVIKTEVYAKSLAENPEDFDGGEYDEGYLFLYEPNAQNQVKATPSKPEERALEDLNAYIQGKLKGKDGGVADGKLSGHQLIPVPLRYRKPGKPKSKEDGHEALQKAIRTNHQLSPFEYSFPDENPGKDKRLLDEFIGCGSHMIPLPELNHSWTNSKTTAEIEQEKIKSDTDGHFQRIFPEDPSWKLGVTERLSEICLLTIQSNFQDMPYQMGALPLELQQRFLADLPTVSETNLYLAADYFHNEDYWERSCKTRWGHSCYTHTHGSWKLTYIERGFQEMIENYVPLQSDPNILLNDLLNIGEYVLQLKVDQLLPPVRHTFGDFAAMVDAQLTNHVQFTEPYETTEADSSPHEERRISVIKPVLVADEVKNFMGNEFPAVKQPVWSDKARIKFQRLVNRELDLNRGIDEGNKLLLNITRDLDDTPAHPRTVNPFVAADHMNLVPVLANMPHLMDLDLRYGVRECGMNFSWRLFQFTLNDAKRLAEALVVCSSLRRLSLQNCRIADAKGVIICQALLDHPNLAILELQRNELSDDTATVIGRMIKRSEVLNKVDLSENKVGVLGAKALARSFVRGTSLRILNLHMNQVSDQGAEAIFLVLKSCITFLEQIVLSGNGITGRIVDLLTESMKSNKRLEKYDLSINELEGTIVARKLQEALTQSQHIQEFWLQENQFSADFEAAVEELLFRNQEGRLEQVLIETENTFDFNIQKVKCPLEDELKSSSEDDSSVSSSLGDIKDSSRQGSGVVEGNSSGSGIGGTSAEDDF